MLGSFLCAFQFDTGRGRLVSSTDQGGGKRRAGISRGVRLLCDRAYIQSRHRDFQDRAGNYRWWSHTASLLLHCVLRMSNLSSEKATTPSDRLVGGWSDLVYSRHSLGLRPEIYIRPN